MDGWINWWINGLMDGCMDWLMKFFYEFDGLMDCPPPPLPYLIWPPRSPLTLPTAIPSSLERIFSTLEIWQSPDKFTGNRRTQIYVYVYIYMRPLFRSTRLGWQRPPLRTYSSIPKKTKIPVGQLIPIRSRHMPRWQYPFEGGRYCCR